MKKDEILGLVLFAVSILALAIVAFWIHWAVGVAWIGIVAMWLARSALQISK